MADRQRISALSAQPSPPSSFDLEAMLAACVPGGDIADPQVIADNIRRWFAVQPSPGGQGDAPPCWWIDHGTYGQITQRQDEADAAVNAGKRVVSYAARQPVYVQGCDELRARTEGERAAYMEGLEEGKKIAARQPLGETDEAAVLRRAAAVLDMWEGDSNQTGYMGDFKDAQAILEVLAQNAAPSAQAVDLADFKALYRAYVRLLESGRDRIRDLGGTCDPVDVMEANDVDLQAARGVIDSQVVGNG